MSEEKDDDTNTMTMFCASCGVAEVDDVKLKDCDDCDLVRYCSDECQEDHRPRHEEECKRRAAELKDEILFKQPESSYLGDCPICCLPIPLDPEKSGLYSCCSKRICKGCHYANRKQGAKRRLLSKCPFCRIVVPETDEQINEQAMKRIEASDPVAICRRGKICHLGGDYKAAFEYFTRAIALEDVQAHHQLSMMYREGNGVEKDENKEHHHAEQAAIGGHPGARHDLACFEWMNGRVDRAAKHWIIAAKLGCDESLGNVKALYKCEVVSKEDFAAALRGHKAAVDATKSPQREEAIEFDEWHAERRSGAV